MSINTKIANPVMSDIKMSLGMADGTPEDESVLEVKKLKKKKLEIRGEQQLSSSGHAGDFVFLSSHDQYHYRSGDEDKGLEKRTFLYRETGELFCGLTIVSKMLTIRTDRKSAHILSSLKALDSDGSSSGADSTCMSGHVGTSGPGGTGMLSGTVAFISWEISRF